MLTVDKVDKQLRKDAIIKGLMLGFTVLVLSIFSFYFITVLTKTMSFIVAGPYIFAVVLPITATALFCFSMRKEIGGYWTFRQAVTGIFLMFLVSYAVLTVGRDLVFAKLIEPDMAPKTEAVMLNVRKASLKLSGASTREINNQDAELKKEFADQKSPGILPVLQNYMLNIIMLFVLAIIFAAIFKKDPPYIEKEIMILEE